jgi:polysaccharide biosynthesis protein VpsQ
MATCRKPNLIRALTFGFVAFLIAMVVVADRGQGSQWWPFVERIPYSDKLGHIALFGTLGFLCNLAFPSRRWGFHPLAITLTTLVLLIVISLEELSQRFIPSRSFDTVDWLADLIGLAIGQLTATALMSRSTSRSSLNLEP